MTTVIDFSAGPPSAESIKAAGHTGVVLYISEGREAWMTGKNPSREYLDSLDREGIKFAFVFQYRKGGSMASGDAGRGFDGGYADAKESLHRLNELNCSGHPVFFAVDWDITLQEWNGRVGEYFRGAIAKLGRERVGIYGHSRVVHWAMEDDVVAEVAPGRVLGWVTESWRSRHPDGTPRGQEYSVLFQGTHNVGGPDGVQVDINQVFHDEWGWRSVADRRTEAPRIELAPVEYPCDMVIDTPDSGWRDPASCQAGVFHTTENGDATPPENVANWQLNPANQSSYNVLVGADATGAKTIRTNPDNRRSWSTGEPGNTSAIHCSGVGWAARTRAQWLANPRQLERMAEWAADLHLRYRLPLVWLTPDDLRAGRKGFTSHGNWWQGIGGPAPRTDPGAGFPHDVVLARAQELTNHEGDDDMSFTDDDRRKLNEVHFQLTHKFDSRYDLDRLKRGEITEDQVYKDAMIGYVLNTDSRSERAKSVTLPAIVEVLEWVKGAVASIASDLKLRKGDQ